MANGNKSKNGGIGESDLRRTRIPLNHGAGRMPALGFGTLIPDAALTLTATRDALDAGESRGSWEVPGHWTFGHRFGRTETRL
jgi:hypothetical protein